MANRFQKLLNKAGGGAAGAGDVVGPGSSTDNAVVRWNGTTGVDVQDSPITISDVTGGVVAIGNVGTVDKITVDLSDGTDTGYLEIRREDVPGRYIRIGPSLGGNALIQTNGTTFFDTGGANDLVFNQNAQFRFSSPGNAGIKALSDTVLKITDGSTGYGWYQWAGESRVTGNQTNGTTTPATTTMSVTLAAGRTYSFRCVMMANTPTAADGFRVDFDGGAATATAFRVYGRGFDSTGAVSASAASSVTALATDFTWTSTTGDAIYEFDGTITVNAGGTFIPRFAKEADAGADATLYAGSYLLVWDMP